MRLPQRTSWASLQEVDELCSWVYSDTTDSYAKTRAVQRLSAWKAITALPHALDSLLSLLVAVLQDEGRSQPISSLSLRQSYATAIIRLVNGLVDPLQVGLYARSIGSIAAQLGLPSWLVELRHAATHEDLPSLELLREGVRESLDWLLHNYFLPLLNPSTSSSRVLDSLRSLEPLLVRYKSLLKITSRDTSLASRHQSDVDKTLRDIERWLGEAAVAARSADEDEREAYAIDRFSDELLRVGALVPLSRKKRIIPKGQVLPPAPLVAIWSPLLVQVRTNHPQFPSALLARAVDCLFGTRPFDVQVPSDEHDQVSYEHCVAGWVMWIVSSDPGLREKAFVLLANGLGPQRQDDEKDLKAARSLLSALSASDTRLTSISQTVLATMKVHTTEEIWDDGHMNVMDKRLRNVLSSHKEIGQHEGVVQLNTSEGLEDIRSTAGWRLIEAGSRWKPCPIGVYLPA